MDPNCVGFYSQEIAAVKSPPRPKSEDKTSRGDVREIFFSAKLAVQIQILVLKSVSILVFTFLWQFLQWRMISSYLDNLH